MEVIRVSHLKKNYGSVQAIDDISFKVTKGSILGILGPNGAGKTTTIECIVGLQKRSSGQVSVLGFDPELHRHKLFDAVGVQLQETVYQSGAKVYELCQLFSAMYAKPLDYTYLLRKFNLEDKTRSYLRQLSGGQRQKIAIILALIGNPQIVFLDELTTGLDPEARREMWSYIKELKDEGRTIIMTTHYMEEAALLCDQICLINNGQIIALDTVDNVIDRASIDLIISFESDENVQQLLANLPNINHWEQNGTLVTIYTDSEQTLTQLVLKFKEQNFPHRKIKITYPELEDAFLKLVNSTRKGAVS